MDSDDSEFYGDEQMRLSLQNRVDNFDAKQWIKQYKACGMGFQHKQASPSDDSQKLHNPYSGIPYAWQLTETLESFFVRLPPATTDQSDETPWIFICNPYIPRQEKRPSENQFNKGNEDEAPAEEGSQLKLVCEGGTERLELLASLKKKLEASGKSTNFVGKEMAKERKQTATDILDLAHAGKVRTGKWLLFCPPTQVNETWEVVAKATANNQLGIAAKVAPRPQFDDVRKDRLVCIYTADFKDRADVGRVLQRLRELKLVESTNRAIYYKPDIYTYIGISHGNPWGMSASMYNSKDRF